MELSAKSTHQKAIDISDYYAVRLRPLWNGVKQESPAFWWLCIYVFLEYVRPQSLYPVVDILPWTQIAFLVAFFMVFNDKSARWVSSPTNGLLVSYLLVILLSSVFAYLPSVSWNKLDIIVSWVLLYFMILMVVNTEKRFIIFILLFFLVNFKMSQNGFMTYAARGFSYARWGLAGSPGWFQNAGDFGIQMALVLPLSVAFILALKDRWGRYKRWLFYLLPLTAMISVVGSASRGAQLGMLATGCWFLLKSGKGIRAMIALLIIGWGVYSLLPERMLEEYHTAGQDATSLERLSLWRYGMTVANDHPLLGVGYENWVDYCWYRYHSPGGLEGIRWCLTTHNTYLLAAAETGYLGLIIYTILIFSILFLNARTRKLARQTNNKFMIYISHGLDGAIIGFVVSTFFFTVLYYPIFWVHLAMTASLHAIANKQLNSKVGNSRARLHP